MKTTTLIALAAITIGGMATGQALFKAASGRGSLTLILWSPIFWGAVLLYGVVTICWVLLLREMDLSRAYPIMAATYVIVPLISFVFLGERVGWTYSIGVALIFSGIAFTQIR
jgi:drug/metabolite transporter (DMT)-like permease